MGKGRDRPRRRARVGLLLIGVVVAAIAAACRPIAPITPIRVAPPTTPTAPPTTTTTEPPNTDWPLETLDDGHADLNDFVPGVVVTEFQGDLHAFYVVDTAGGAELRHAVRHAGQWTYGSVPHTGLTGDPVYAESAVADGDTLHVFYGFRPINGGVQPRTLVHAALHNGAWTIETVDGDSNVGGRAQADTDDARSAIVDGAGTLHIFYDQRSGGSAHIRHAARAAGGAWTYETVDGAGGTHGETSGGVVGPLAVVGPDDVLHLFYSDGSATPAIRHTYWDTDHWVYTGILDAGNNTGFLDSVTATDQAVYAFMTDPHTNQLREGRLVGGTWTFADVPGATLPGEGVGEMSALGYADDTVELFYLAAPIPANGDPLTVRLGERSGGTWGFGTVLDEVSFVGIPFVAADLDGVPHLFMTQDNGRLLLHLFPS